MTGPAKRFQKSPGVIFGRLPHIQLFQRAVGMLRKNRANQSRFPGLTRPRERHHRKFAGLGFQRGRKKTRDHGLCKNAFRLHICKMYFNVRHPVGNVGMAQAVMNDFQQRVSVLAFDRVHRRLEQGGQCKSEITIETGGTPVLPGRCEVPLFPRGGISRLGDQEIVQGSIGRA